MTGGDVALAIPMTLVGADRTMFVEAARNLNVSSSIMGGYAPVKTGAGTLTLSGNNAFTGNMLVKDGKLITTGDSTAAKVAVGTATGEVATWEYTGGTFVGGSGQIMIGDANGVGTMNMSGGSMTVNSWFALGRAGAGQSKGTFNMTGGDFKQQTAGSIAISTGYDSVGTVNISGGTFETTSTLYLGENGSYLYGSAALNLSNTGVVKANLLRLGEVATKVSTLDALSGTICVNAISQGSGKSYVTLSGTTLQTYTATLGAFSADMTLDNAAGATTISCTTQDGTTPADITVSGRLSGSGALTKAGSGTLTLTAANQYTGATVIDAGTLLLTLNGSISGTASLSIAPGGMLSMDLSRPITVASVDFAPGSRVQVLAAPRPLLADDYPIFIGVTVLPATLPTLKVLQAARAAPG